MPREFDPVAVRARLEFLRASWVPLSAAEARLQMEPPRARKTFAQAVAERLAELRALDELTRRLHLARRSSPAK